MEGVKINYSREAMILINTQKEFDKEEFERIYLQNLGVCAKDILDYIMRKANERQRAYIKSKDYIPGKEVY